MAILTRYDAHDEAKTSFVPLLLSSRDDWRAKVGPVTPDMVEPRVILKPIKKTTGDDDRNVRHHGPDDWLLKEDADHVGKPQGGGAPVLEETGAEDKGEEPEDGDHHHVQYGYHNEEHDVDRQSELEVIDQVEVRQGLIVDFQVVYWVIARAVLDIVREEDGHCGHEFYFSRLLVVKDVHGDHRRETRPGDVRVEEDRQQAIVA